MTVIAVYQLILCMMTMTMFQGHMCVKTWLQIILFQFLSRVVRWCMFVTYCMLYVALGPHVQRVSSPINYYYLLNCDGIWKKKKHVWCIKDCPASLNVKNIDQFFAFKQPVAAKGYYWLIEEKINTCRPTYHWRLQIIQEHLDLHIKTSHNQHRHENLKWERVILSLTSATKVLSKWILSLGNWQG